jgi:hypothetical protein
MQQENFYPKRVLFLIPIPPDFVTTLVPNRKFKKQMKLFLMINYTWAKPWNLKLSLIENIDRILDNIESQCPKTQVLNLEKLPHYCSEALNFLSC